MPKSKNKAVILPAVTDGYFGDEADPLRPEVKSVKSKVKVKPSSKAKLPELELYGKDHKTGCPVPQASANGEGANCTCDKPVNGAVEVTPTQSCRWLADCPVTGDRRLAIYKDGKRQVYAVQQTEDGFLMSYRGKEFMVAYKLLAVAHGYTCDCPVYRYRSDHGACKHVGALTAALITRPY